MNIVDKILGVQHSEIRPLNLNGKTYEQTFREPAPRHLGIGLLSMYDKSTAKADQLILIQENMATRQTLTVLFNYEEFRKEFLPPGVEKVTVREGMVQTDPGYWQMFPEPIYLWCQNGATIQVVLYDADRQVSDDDLMNMALAMAFVDHWVADTCTTNPAAHRPQSAKDPESAKYYADCIGKLYKSGIGRWSEALVGFRNVMMVGMKACLEREAMLDHMRTFKLGKQPYYWDYRG
ncbi:MAG: hypothetical protein IPK53_11775 [bacterium]|nr:hypothetical protein [bacterium]